MNDADLDRLIAELPPIEPPADLDASILAMIDETPQDAAPEPAPASQPLTEPDPTPAPANRRWWMLAGPLVVVAAAALIAFNAISWDPAVGDPDDWTLRGDPGTGPGVELSLAVQTDSGTDRFERGRGYGPGDTLLFRVDAYAGGAVHLVRVDADGAELLHVQSLDAPGTADLQTGAGRVGYALEKGEEEAVFAVIRTEEPLSPGAVSAALAVGPDVEAVCVAAWELGGRCSAERVEAVR